MKTNKWLQGYACAVAMALNKANMADTITVELYNEAMAGYSEKDLRKQGVDEFDIEALKKHGLLNY